MSNDKKTVTELKDLWNELGLCVTAMEKDLDKNLNKNNSAAGRRVRAQLRKLKEKSTELIRELVKLDKAKD